ERHRRRLQKIDALEGRYCVYIQQIQKRVRRLEPITRDRYEAVLLDLDGVITDTADVHAACWKTMFDEYLQKWARQNARPVRAFDVATDYKVHVDGNPRFQGVRDFLRSRGIIVPEGKPDDPPTAETIYGLGNRKSELVNNHLASAGVDAYPGSVAFLKYLRTSGIKTAVVTSSQNSQTVLHAARIDHLFDARVDGSMLLHEGLMGKPSPDSLLKATEILRVAPERAVVIDDSISGVRAGAQGGFGLVVGVNRKGNADELKA